MRYQGKYFAPSERKPVAASGILTRVAALLLCFVIASACMMSGLLAKYSTTGSGSDEARVAKFEVDVVYKNGDVAVSGITANLKYNEQTGSYTITVINNSEVAISYDIRIEDISLVTTKKTGEVVAATAKTKGISVKLDDGASKTLDESIQTVNFGLFEDLTPGAPARPHTLAFSVEWEEYTESAIGDFASVTITFNVVVDVEQVD